MHQFFKARPRLLLTGLIACAALAACGGGDGQDDSLAQNEGGARATAQATQTSSWKWIANENGKFTLSAQKTVRYGANGKYTQKSLAAGTYSCSSSFFGGDPIRGSFKHCDVYTGTTSTVPAPTTSTASLMWDPSTSNVAGYRLYYGTASRTYQQAKGSGIAVGNVTNYKVTLTSGKLYYFAVTSIDSNGNESGYSNEVSKTVP
jgi:hypothetical protein